MNLFIRCATALGVCSVVVAGVSFACPTWTRDLGLDIWNVPNLNRQLANDQAIRDDLNVKDAVVLRRIRAKEAVIVDLADEKLTLLEAAAHFRALNAGRSNYRELLRLAYRGQTDEERLCRNVIAFADAMFQQDPSRAAEVNARLEAELQRHLARGPLTELPD